MPASPTDTESDVADASAHTIKDFRGIPWNESEKETLASLNEEQPPPGFDLNLSRATASLLKKQDPSTHNNLLVLKCNDLNLTKANKGHVTSNHLEHH
ncbi:hypothetical protein [Absidia glauca]|uniref:Uncharacterized protein n=1 Tax=Absidia glauca TaxID=4829 RepID=A0A168MHF8_ABSGL|nr:hypothetical protein [Absidia glauca]